MRSITNKTTHLGRSGEFAAMSEILARGWNVAIPEVDVGSDVFVAQDDGTRLTRVQVKTTHARMIGDQWVSETVKVPYPQLMREGDEVPLLYVFTARVERGWEFVVIPQADLRDVWRRFERARDAVAESGRRPPGRPRKNPSEPREAAAFELAFSTDDVIGPGGQSLRAWRNGWDCFELLMLSDDATQIATEPGRSSNPGPPRHRAGRDRRGSGSSGGG